MDIKGPLVAVYDHDWPHYELYLYKIIDYITLFSHFLLSLVTMNESMALLSLSNCLI